jgi:Plasmid pRiA4b ORF-3-like protein
MAKESKEASPFFRLRVTLADISPPIWREVVVRAGTTLDTLHEVLQVVMGWEDSHMHAFRVGKIEFGDPESDADAPIRSEMTATIDELARLTRRKPTLYEYDFGDSWVHEILIEPEQDEPNLARRRATIAWCVGGARACPPEDCGGAPGYEDLADAIADEESPQHEELMEWLGRPFDPERFDVVEVNRKLAKLRVLF